MMYLILTTVFLTAILRLKADAVKPAARAGILLLLFFCAASVRAGRPAIAEQAGPEIPAPEFSRVSGFYDTPFELTILSEEGLSVYYTRDGSIPDETDALYTGPLEVVNRTYEKNVLSDRTDIIAPNKWGDAIAPLMKVDKAYVIRAVAVDGQGNRSAVSTAVYFIGYQDKAEFYRNYKVISLTVDPGDLFDPARGIYIQGNSFDEWLHSDAYDPSLDEWLIPGNYLNRGREWERQARMQVFEGGPRCFPARSGSASTEAPAGTANRRASISTPGRNTGRRSSTMTCLTRKISARRRMNTLPSTTALSSGTAGMTTSFPGFGTT